MKLWRLTGTSVSASPQKISVGTAILRSVVCWSRRRCSARIWRVGVFVNADRSEIERIRRDVDLSAIQLHGEESPEDCAACVRPVLKRIDVKPGDDVSSLQRRLDRYDVAGWVLDPGAGDGETFDWTVARGLSGPLVIAGGLNPHNVAEAVRIAGRPVVAIGGVTPENVGLVGRAGASAFAVISAVSDAIDPEAALRKLARGFADGGRRWSG